jgi:DNA-binding HxlR family transcriptional regulator
LIEKITQKQRKEMTAIEHRRGRTVLDLIADKWTALALGALDGKTERFGKLRREIDGVSQKMLTHTLRELEMDGLVVRHVYATVPPKVEYSITDLGKSFLQLLKDIREWSKRNSGEILKARDAYAAKMRSEELFGSSTTDTADDR